MVCQRVRGISVAVAIVLSFGAAAGVSAANVWLQNTQLEQFWSGGQWKDSTSDTTTWNSKALITSIIHAVNSNPNGLIDQGILYQEYDAENETIQQLNRAYDKAQGLWADTVSGMKWTRLKDANKRDTVVEIQTWNPTDDKWYKVTKSKYHYHANGLIDTTIEAVWDTSGGVGKWLNTTRTVDVYSGLKSVLTLMDTWRKGDQIWLKKDRLARVYTGTIVVADTSASWDTTDSKYLYTGMHTYEYNAAGKDTSTITMAYSKSLDAFLNTLRETFAYDANGNQTNYVTYRWTKNPSGNGIWLQTRRQTQTYNAKSQIVTTLQETYDSAASKWNKGAYQEWAYDGNDNALSETFSNWDTTVNPDAFVPSRKLSWTYNMTTVGVFTPIASAVIAAPKTSFLINTRNVIVSGREGMSVSIFGMNGRQFASLTAAKGVSSIAWNYTDARGNRIPVGCYALKVSAPGFSAAYPLSICR
jgi:hypothetical protein